MPAWGVRTALTALRTFMAEKGTAGQVGGLEAARDVRERLARDSRKWRCEGCGGKTNAEIMAHWWEACREKGVRVGGDGEEVAMETTAEDVKIEARAPAVTTEADEVPASSQTTSEYQPLFHEMDTKNLVDQNKQIPQSDGLPINDVVQTSNSAENGQGSGTRQRISPSRQNDSVPLLSTTSLNAATVISSPAQSHRVEDQTAGLTNITTIDKAIGAIFLALFLMVLKKFFYPASMHSLDDFNLPEG